MWLFPRLVRLLAGSSQRSLLSALPLLIMKCHALQDPT